MSSNRARALLLALIVSAVVAFFALDLGRYLTVEGMAARRDAVQAYRAAHPITAAAGIPARLRRHGCRVAAGRVVADPGRRRRLRAGARHAAGVVRVVDWRHAGLSVRTLHLPGLGAGPAGPSAREAERGRPPRRRLPPGHLAAAAGAPVLGRQPGDGADTDRHLDLLLGQPARHAASHGHLCLRRHAADAVPCRPGARDRPRAAGWLFAVRQAPGGRHQRAACLQALEGPPPEAVRLQRGSHRRRLRGSRGVLHRGRHQGQGGADRKTPHGRRLPEHRLRAQQGAAAIGEAARPDVTRARLGHRRSQGVVHVLGCDGPRDPRHQGDRAARLARALHRSWVWTCIWARPGSRRRGPSKCRGRVAPRP